MTGRKAILTGIILVILSFQALVLIILTFFPYMPDFGLSNLNMEIYFFLAPLSTVFLIMLLYAWLFRLLARVAILYSSTARSAAHFLSEPFDRINSSVRERSLLESARRYKMLSRPRFLLAIGVAVSVFLSFVPYRPDLNPKETLIGVDSPLYVTWITQMLAGSLPQALQYSFVEGQNGSRPLLLIVLYIVSDVLLLLFLWEVQIV